MLTNNSKIVPAYYLECAYCGETLLDLRLGRRFCCSDHCIQFHSDAAKAVRRARAAELAGAEPPPLPVERVKPKGPSEGVAKSVAEAVARMMKGTNDG